jgi:phenylacetate-coenzyme A ligase PaaK-like adenylate-forming protein
VPKLKKKLENRWVFKSARIYQSADTGKEECKIGAGLKAAEVQVC